MNLYIITISETGGLIATSEKPQVSKLGLRRKAGQRYQIASVARHVTEELKNPELIDAVAHFMGDIKNDIDAKGFCEISWAVPSEDDVRILNREDNEWITINRKWANWDMEKLDEILTHYMAPAQGATGATTEAQATGNASANSNVSGARRPTF